MTEPKRFADIEALKTPETAEFVLKTTIAELSQNNDSDSFLLALSKLTKAQGGMSALSNKVDINRQNLYRTFARTGNPKFRSLAAILQGLGYRLSIEALPRTEEANKQLSAQLQDDLQKIDAILRRKKQTEEVA